MLYNYYIKTTNGEAQGTLEANSEEDAKQLLTAQYIPAEHGFVDEDGEPVPHELKSIELHEV